MIDSAAGADPLQPFRFLASHGQGSMKKSPLNREATPREKKAVLTLISWVAACFVISFFDLKWGVVLFVSGFFAWLIFARV